MSRKRNKLNYGKYASNKQSRYIHIIVSIKNDMPSGSIAIACTRNQLLSIYKNEEYCMHYNIKDIDYVVSSNEECQRLSFYMLARAHSLGLFTYHDTTTWD